MTNSSKIVLERIDHGVLPSNDLARAFPFWSGLMGGQVGHHTNFNARGLNREVPMISFMTVANPRGFGLALQDFRISPNPARRLEGIVWGFEVAADNLDMCSSPPPWRDRSIKSRSEKSRSASRSLPKGQTDPPHPMRILFQGKGNLHHPRFPLQLRRSDHLVF